MPFWRSIHPPFRPFRLTFWPSKIFGTIFNFRVTGPEHSSHVSLALSSNSCPDRSSGQVFAGHSLSWEVHRGSQSPSQGSITGHSAQDHLRMALRALSCSLPSRLRNNLFLNTLLQVLKDFSKPLCTQPPVQDLRGNYLQ